MGAIGSVPPSGDGSTVLTSLVLVPDNGRCESSPALQACPRVAFWYVNTRTGEKRPGRCDRYACEFCGPWRVREWSWVLTWGLPQRFVTLTQAGDDAERRRARVRDFRYEIRKAGYAWQDAWSTHVNPRCARHRRKGCDRCPEHERTGHHVHMLQHGDYVPQAELSAIADSCGLGRVADIRYLHEGGGVGSRTAAYVLKEGVKAIGAAGYSMTEALRHDKRPVHLSRGYLRGAGVQEARRAVRELRWGPPTDDWVKVDRENWLFHPTPGQTARRRVLGLGSVTPTNETDAL